MPGCAIKACKSRSSTHNLQNDGITFHLFPKNKQQKERWVQATGKPDSWSPTKTSTICSKHFARDCFDVTKNSRRMIFEFAVPTLHLNNTVAEKDAAPVQSAIPAPEIIIKCTCPNAQVVGTRLRKLEVVVRSQKKKIKHLHYKNRKFEAKVETLKETLRLLRENLELTDTEFLALTKTADKEKSKETKLKEPRDEDSDISVDSDDDPLSEGFKDKDCVKEDSEVSEDPLNCVNLDIDIKEEKF